MAPNKVVPKIGWGGMEGMTTSFEVRTVYELLDVVRQKSGLFIGDPSVKGLAVFIEAFRFGLASVGQSFDEEEPPFSGFHDWIAARYGYSDSCRGWSNMLLESLRNEEAALAAFFTELDEFRRRPIAPIEGRAGPRPR